MFQNRGDITAFSGAITTQAREFTADTSKTATS